MHLLGRAQDGVDRAGLDAQRAADAQALVDVGDRARTLDAIDRVDRDDRAPGRRSQAPDAFDAAGRTLVDVGVARCDGVGIRPAGGVAALGALGLRQQVLEDVGERLGHGGCKIGKDAIIVQKRLVLQKVA